MGDIHEIRVWFVVVIVVTAVGIVVINERVKYYDGVKLGPEPQTDTNDDYLLGAITELLDGGRNPFTPGCARSKLFMGIFDSVNDIDNFCDYVLSDNIVGITDYCARGLLWEGVYDSCTISGFEGVFVGIKCDEACREVHRDSTLSGECRTVPISCIDKPTSAKCVCITREGAEIDPPDDDNGPSQPHEPEDELNEPEGNPDEEGNTIPVPKGEIT
jgi:hypothetical protein